MFYAYVNIIRSSPVAREPCMNKPFRKPTNLSIDSELLEEAKTMDVNLSRAAESGLKIAVAAAKAKLWTANNASSLMSSNEFVEKHGLPLDKYRQF